ncbi:prolyl oligopeptidase family serine peptidase [Halobellus sp. GM3]|uniref:prolyl oligopeptidase family serine peptidase n=1 Tax=Halobellus sp. GM3 TaxID=3458410 RepID=UPI00403D7A70
MVDALADAVGIDVVRGMPFATVDVDAQTGGDTLRLDLFRPAAAASGPSASRNGPAPAPTARRAAVVLVSGGQRYESDRGELARYALDLAERGYVCVVPEYRGSDAAAFPAQIRDLKAAVRWLRASAAGVGVDPDRIGAFGHGAGAHLAVLTGLTSGVAALEPDTDRIVADAAADPDRASDALGAVVGVAGTYALEHQPETDALVSLLGGDRDAAPAAWTRASPSTYLGGGSAGAGGPAGGSARDGGSTTHVEGDGESAGEPTGEGEAEPSAATDAPPMLLLHGEDDGVVPAMASELFYDILQAHDVPAECAVAAGAGHDVHETQRAFTLGWAEGFFDRHLR